MQVGQAKEIVRQWIAAEASRTPRFHGAFFHGSINELPDGATLSHTSDVDVIIVVHGPTLPKKPGKLMSQGVLIDASYLPADDLQSAEQLLGLSHLAGSLCADSLIADPTGQLRVVQAGIANDYAKQEWVARRCEHAAQRVLTHLDRLDGSLLFHDQMISWLFGTGVTAHVLLAAGLKNLTVRKRYLAVRQLLVEYGQADFYPALLEMLGCAHINQELASEHLNRLEAAFDAARVLIRSPYPFAADISYDSRKLAIDGSRELIEQGNAPEAMFWIAVTYSRCMKVLWEDGTAEVFQLHDPGYRLLMADMGIQSSNDLWQHTNQVRAMLPRIWLVAQAIMAANSEIKE
jgi:hypothetical protein